jgi:hypothetical protein
MQLLALCSLAAVAAAVPTGVQPDSGAASHGGPLSHWFPELQALCFA